MTVSFEDDLGKRHFEFVFLGFIVGGSIQEKKGISVLRSELAIFEKLERISEPTGKKLANGEPERRLTQAPEAQGPDDVTPSATLQLTTQECELLVTYMSGVPWQTGTAVKYALETIDWLESQRGAKNG